MWQKWSPFPLFYETQAKSMQYSRRDASKGKISSHSLRAGQQNVPPSAGGLQARLEEDPARQRPSSAPLTGRWKTDDLWLSAVGGWRISPDRCGHVLQPVSDQHGLTPSLVSTEKSAAWFLINPFFWGIFLCFISFLFAELISEMYVALNTKDGHNIRVIFHDQLPTSVLITSTTTSTCDAGVSQGMHHSIVIKKWLHCLFVRFTRAEGQIQNVITYKMKKLIEQS